MTETLAYGCSSESTQLELSNEYQQALDNFQESLSPCALDESCLSIRRVKGSNEFAVANLKSDRHIFVTLLIE